MVLELLATLPLEKEYQKIIAQVGDNKTKRILAHSSHVDPTVALSLASDQDYVTRTYALRFCTDTDFIQSKHSEHAKNIKTQLELARNTHLPYEIAIKLLESSNYDLQFAGFTHPSIPVDEKKEKLTPSIAKTLINRGGCVGDRVVKAYELVLNNPYILDTIDTWDHYIKRALLGVDFITIDYVEYLKESRFKGLTSDKYLRLISILKNTDNFTIDHLTSLAEPLADLLVLKNPNTSLDQARKILTNSNKLRKSVGPEPHIIGRLVKRFGSHVLFNASDISDTRIRTASFVTPEVQYYNILRKLTDEVLEIPEILGLDLVCWDNFSQLSKTWDKDLISLAHASVKL